MQINQKGRCEIITLYTHNKTLVTSPIKTLIRHGEKNFDIVKIVLERYYGELDLADFNFIIEAKNSLGSGAVAELEKVYDSEKITLSWTITADFTAVSGDLELKLKVISADGQTVAVFVGGKVEVVGESFDDILPVDVQDQLLTVIENKITSIEVLTEQAVEEKTQQFITNFDATPYVESCLPDNLVTSNTVRVITVLSESEFSQIATPSDDVLYVII